MGTSLDGAGVVQLRSNRAGSSPFQCTAGWSLRFSAEIAALALSQDSLSVLVGKGGPLQPWQCPGAHPPIGRSPLRLMTVLRMLC